MRGFKDRESQLLMSKRCGNERETLKTSPILEGEHVSITKAQSTDSGFGRLLDWRRYIVTCSETGGGGCAEQSHQKLRPPHYGYAKY